MSTERTDLEYGVEVPGKGYATDAQFGLLILSDDPCTGTMDMASAEAAVERVRKVYQNLRMPEVADTIRLISRQITTYVGDWGPHYG